MSITADQFCERCDRMAVEGLKIRPAVEACKEIVEMDIDDCFLKRQSPNGEPWKPRKDKKPHPLLEQTGALRAAAAGPAPGHVEEVTDNAATVGVEKIDLGGLPGALAHNYGCPKKNIPQRRFIGISADAFGICVDETAEITTGILINNWQ